MPLRIPRYYHRTVTANTLLLLDSGGQYECGTTDITRCVHFGTPSVRHKMAYTRVLQVGGSV